MRENTCCLFFCVWLILPNIKSSRSIHFVKNDKISFLFMGEHYPIVQLSHFFMHTFIDGQLDWFHIFTTINHATTNVGVQLSLWYADSISFGYVHRSGMAGSYDRSTFSFVRHLHPAFHYGFINLHSHQWCLRIFSPYSCQYLSFDFWL
jgi:hypothetical protein